jgi:hypothetical protein
VNIADEVSDFFRYQSKPKLVVGGMIVLAFLALVIINPYDGEYYMAVEEELPLAMAICENSAEWVRENPERLKMTQNNLDHIEVNGEIPKLKYIKYPRALILHDGYGHANAQVEIYCTFQDPRGGGGKTYFYDYRRAGWVDKTLSRR